MGWYPNLFTKMILRSPRTSEYEYGNNISWQNTCFSLWVWQYHSSVQIIQVQNIHVVQIVPWHTKYHTRCLEYWHRLMHISKGKIWICGCHSPYSLYLHMRLWILMYTTAKQWLRILNLILSPFALYSGSLIVRKIYLEMNIRAI